MRQQQLITRAGKAVIKASGNKNNSPAQIQAVLNKVRDAYASMGKPYTAQ